MKKETQIAIFGAEVAAGAELTAAMITAADKAFAEANQKTTDAEALIQSLTEAAAAKDEEMEALRAEIALTKTEVSKHTKMVEGSHKYSGKEAEFKGKSYAFKKGHLKVRLPRIFHREFGVDPIDSAELLSDKKFKEAMNHLVEIGFGGLEEIIE